jgi:metallophosphoesterase superfamily enzyme
MRRRQFLQTAGVAALAPFSSVLGAPADPNKFYFAVIADTHIIDDYYTGAEEAIRDTAPRLTAARDALNQLQPAMERVFVVGDYFHDYPSTDIDFYFQNKTRIDRAKELTDGFKAPVHVGFGNHDYGVPKVSREFSHELFRRKLGIDKPYYSVEHKGWKFVHLNNFQGTTWQAGHADFNKGRGSLGLGQLEWFEAELAQKKPTFVFVHFPLASILPVERADFGLHPLLRKHRESIQHVISGHQHKWVDHRDTFGPQHLVMAATRYDEDAYLIVEADRKKMTHRLLNLDLVEWNTHFSKPFRFA